MADSPDNTNQRSLELKLEQSKLVVKKPSSIPFGFFVDYYRRGIAACAAPAGWLGSLNLQLAFADYRGEGADFFMLVETYRELLMFETQIARVGATLAGTIA